MKKTKGFMILLIALNLIIPHVVLAVSHNWWIDGGEDDVFLTGSGILFTDTELIPLRDPALDVTVGLKFDTITVSRDDYINNATLSIYFPQNQTLALGSQVTVYGIDRYNCPSIDDSLTFSSIPITTAYSNWNLTDIPEGWYNVTVTDIVREIINGYGWSHANDIGFKILGSTGTSRHFAGYEYFSDWGARLYITYNEYPPAPSGFEYMETYRGYAIFREYDRWFNYTLFNSSRSDANGRIDYLDYYGYNITGNIRDEDPIRLQYNHTIPVPVNGTNWYTRFFGLNMTAFWNVNPAEQGWITLIYALTNHDTNITRYWNGSDDVGEGGYYISIETNAGPNQVRFSFRSREETGVGMQQANGGDNTIWVSQADLPHLIYVRLELNPVSANFRLYYYTDEEMTNLWQSASGGFVEVGGFGIISYNSAMLESVLLGTSNPQDPHDGDTVSFRHFRPQNITLEYRAQYPNGTALTDCEDLTTLEAIQNCIDIDIGYPDPEDPDPPSSNPDIPDPISRFRLKMYAVIFGLCAIFLPMIAGVYYRVSLSSWVAILFVAVLGYAILNFSQFM